MNYSDELKSLIVLVKTVHDTFIADPAYTRTKNHELWPTLRDRQIFHVLSCLTKAMANLEDGIDVSRNIQGGQEEPR